MNLFNEDSKNVNRNRAIKGDFERMMKERKKMLPDIQESIEGLFENYNGEMVAVVRIHEDENGDPVSSRTFVGGVANFKSSIKMASALDEAANDIREHIGKGLADHPEALGEMLGDMLKKVIEDMKEDK